MSFTGYLTRPQGSGHRPSLLVRLSLAHAVRRQRRTLAALTPEQLNDIGLSAEAARREALRPAWDVPAHWLR